jgi:hypothetical protein
MAIFVSPFASIVAKRQLVMDCFIKILQNIKSSSRGENMIGKIDNLFLRFWKIPLQIICNITGQSNFFAAKITLGIGWGLVVFTEILHEFARLHPFALFSALLGFGCCLSVFITAERKWESNPAFYPFEHAIILVIIGVRLAIFVIAVSQLLPFFRGHDLPILGELLTSGSFYFATEITPGGPSLFQRMSKFILARFDHGVGHAPT